MKEFEVLLAQAKSTQMVTETCSFAILFLIKNMILFKILWVCCT
jgi:hypothetical protein